MKQIQYTSTPSRPHTNKGKSGSNRGISSNQPIKRRRKKPIKRQGFHHILPPQKKETAIQRPKTKQNTSTNTELRRISRLVSEGVSTSATVRCVQCPSQQVAYDHPHLT